MNKNELKGVIPAIVTPFDEDEMVDESALRAVTKHVVDNGVHGIMTTGGTGEFPLLSREEKKEVTRIVVEASEGKAPIIAGTAACSTREVLQLIEDTAEVGAAAAIVTPPFYFILPEEALYQHYVEIAKFSPIPIVVYNNPLYTGNNLSPNLLARLAEVDNVIGLKQSQDDLGQLVEALRLAGEQISICTGIDSQFYAALCVGATGIFSTAATVCPQHMVELYDHTLAGRHSEALALHNRLQNLNKYLEYDPGYVAPAKEALNMMGIPVGSVRRPLPDLTEDEKAGVRKALVTLDLLPA
ncbi:MAG: 4-hydroxy-tetrahydrodipicolinate synthase [Chloroflexi bacterium]|nr:4-hydroxy-tetrahydrodipicolinate synthase [Chloroflexota bacterium]